MKKMMKAVAAIMLMTAAVFAAGCTKPEPSSGSYNGHEYVDLGLPSGTMWATSNVDAGNAKGYAYFAWGETETKTTYDWSTYKYTAGGEYPPRALTKYCDKSNYGYNGFTDNLTELLPEDDPATVHWGDGWRTPTKEDWQELADNCTYEWTKRNGINGGLFTASNGNTLFLPAAGQYDNPEAGGLIYYNESGNYWSSSLYSYDSPDGAYVFHVHELGTGHSGIPRTVGYTIRPVH